jgi:hypothetical protein
MPCYGLKPKVGLRLAILNNSTQEFTRADGSPEAKFYVGTIIKLVDGDLVTIAYDGGPHGSTSITCGWDYYQKFCIPLPDHERKLMAEFSEEQRKKYGSDDAW